MFGQIASLSLLKFSDLSWREFNVLFPLVYLVFLMGIYPVIFLDVLTLSVNNYINLY
jgi:NADH:ubiquinone oxidoreductase subunit 4 (subunit M)